MNYKTFLWLMAFSLLIAVSSAALNQAADEAIRQAIKSAVLDGLNVVQTFTRNNYWYYLYGSERASFNVSILSDSLNYIVIYKNKGAYYRVNCNLGKVFWKPSINSFVKIQMNDSVDNITSIGKIVSQNNVIDLTNQMDPKPFNVSLPQTSSDQSQPTNTIQVIKPMTPTNQGFVVLSTNPAPTSPNLTSNKPS